MLLVCWTQACRNFVLFPVTHLPISSKCKILQDNIILFLPYDLRQISRLFSHLHMCYILILRSHSETPHSVELLWTSDWPIADTSTWKQTAFTTDRYPCPQQGLNLQPQHVSSCRPMPYTMWPLGLSLYSFTLQNYNVAAVSDNCLSGNNKCFCLLSSSCFSVLWLLFLYPDCELLHTSFSCL